MAADRGFPRTRHPTIHVIRQLCEAGIVERIGAGGVQQPMPPFVGTIALRDFESIASPNQNLQKCATNPTNNTLSASTVNHFIRRQRRKPLEDIPILTHSEHPNSPVGKYQASLSALANSDSSNRLTSVVPMADETDLAWLRLPLPRKNLG